MVSWRWHNGIKFNGKGFETLYIKRKISVDHNNLEVKAYWEYWTYYLCLPNIHFYFFWFFIYYNIILSLLVVHAILGWDLPYPKSRHQLKDHTQVFRVTSSEMACGPRGIIKI